MADLHFYFDPVCPFAWMTSKWVRMVQAQRDYSVEWRFISLRLINAHLDYDTHFPAGYDAGHTAGLRLLRVASAVRETAGPAAVGDFYEAIGTRIFDTEQMHDLVEESGLDRRGTPAYVAPVLARLGLPADLVDALDDESRDPEIRASSDEALALTGKDVGTPIISFRPDEPDGGVAFFGPVISRLPAPDRAVELWDHVVGLAGFPGFAELKRSLRERPQLRAFGIDPEESGVVEDWHAGSRRLKK